MFVNHQATNGIFPISPITGQQNALKAKDALKGGVYSGTGNALEKLADFAIKRAESMSPVIVVGSGRVVDVVFRKGFDLKQDDEGMQLVTSGNYPTNTNYPSNKEDYSSYQNNYQNHSNTNYSNANSGASRVSSFGKTNYSKANLKLRERFIKDSDKNQLSDTLEGTTQLEDNLNLEDTVQQEGSL